MPHMPFLLSWHEYVLMHNLAKILEKELYSLLVRVPYDPNVGIVFESDPKNPDENPVMFQSDMHPNVGFVSHFQIYNIILQFLEKENIHFEFDMKDILAELNCLKIITL